jgi:hypothetical protein
MRDGRLHGLMSLSPWPRMAAALLGAGALVVLLFTLGAPRDGMAQSSTCAQDLPEATDGRFTLDRPTARPGDDILGVLTGFQQWPVGLIGGGSGETFLSCTPWAPEGSAEVIRNQGAPFVLLPVPASATPGTYEVSVVFQEGSTQPGPPGDGRTARLAAEIVVTAQPAAPSAATSPACQVAAATAPTGRLVVAAPARPGQAVAITLEGVAGSSLSTMNEYDRLWFVACFAGSADPIAGVDDPPATFQVDVPPGLVDGRHPLRVIGLLDGQVVAWELAVDVRSTGTSPDDGLAGTGASTLALVLAGAVAFALGVLAVEAARR